MERYPGRLQLYGLKVGIRNSPSLFAVCTIRTPEHGEARLPAVELKSSGTVLFEFVPPKNFKVPAGKDFLKGEIQFSLWKDSALSEKLAETEWEGWGVSKEEHNETPGGRVVHREIKKSLQSMYESFWTFESSAWKMCSPQDQGSGKSGSRSSQSSSSSNNSKRDDSQSSRRNGTMTVQEALEILRLKKQASDDEIRLAYRNQIKKYHPDRVADLADEFKVIAESKTKMLNLAYEMLKPRA